jgi:hypothetical protein
MKIIYLLLTCLINGEKIIKNMEIPACRNCIHYKPYISGLGSDYSSSLSECHKFGTKDIITDKIRYDSPSLARDNEEKCGKEGKYFVEDSNLPLTKIIYFFQSRWVWLLLISSTFLSAFVNVYTKR